MNRYARDTSYDPPPRWGRLYDRYFPEFTCACSRHAKMHAESLRGIHSPLRRLLIDEGYEPDHIASSLELTVKTLWEARRKISKLEGLT